MRKNRILAAAIGLLVLFAMWIVLIRHLNVQPIGSEGNAEARFFFRGRGWAYTYCNRHGFYRQKV